MHLHVRIYNESQISSSRFHTCMFSLGAVWEFSRETYFTPNSEPTSRGEWVLMHDMTREENNKREVLLTGLDGGTQRMLPGFLFTRSEEARHACQQRNHKLANPLFRASLAGITSITALQETKKCKAIFAHFLRDTTCFPISIQCIVIRYYRAQTSHRQNVRLHTYTAWCGEKR